MAGQPAEDLSLVPREMILLRMVFGSLRLADCTSVEAEQRLVKAGGPIHLVRYQQHEVRPHGERAQVEDLVVEHTERETVALVVWSARLVPTNVCRLERKGVRSQPHVE